jgi:hypothetical protein
VDVSTSAVAAKVGQTVTVPITGHNRGPNAIWAFAVGNVSDEPDFTFVGYTGCAEAQTPIFCSTSYVRSGGSATIGLRIKVTHCGPGKGALPVEYRDGFTSREIPIEWVFIFSVTVAGCAPAAPPPAAGHAADPGNPAAGGAPAAVAPAAAPTSAATESSPAGEPLADQAGAQMVPTSNNRSRSPLSIALLLVAFLVGAGGLTWYRWRRHPGAAPALPGQSMDA